MTAPDGRRRKCRRSGGKVVKRLDSVRATYSLDEAGYEAIIDSLSEGVYVTDPDCTILSWNRACRDITGYEAEERWDRRCSDGMLVHVDRQGRPLCDDGCPMKATLADGVPREAEVYLHHREGHRVPVRMRTRALRRADGETEAVVQTFVPTTDKIAALEQVKELQELVYIDALTGIANRRFLERTIDEKLEEYRRYGRTFGLVMIDIDHFKAVNDKYGHGVGDSVLRTVAKTLRSATRAFDLVGRWGGDELLAVVTQTTESDLRVIAERYRALAEVSDVEVGDTRIRTTISAGAATAVPGDDAASAIQTSR